MVRLVSALLLAASVVSTGLAPAASAAVGDQLGTAASNAGAQAATVPVPANSASQAVVPPAKNKPANAKTAKKRTVQAGPAPCVSWIDYSRDPKAVILCVHGLGLHNGTYSDFGKRMCQYGYAVYAIDMRGFGSFMESKGEQRVDFDGCLEDIHSTLKVLHRLHPGLPVFVLGESMGGAIALRATAEYPDLIDGLVSSVPSGDRFKQGKSELRVALHLLDGANKPFDVGEDVVEQATQKPELRAAWSNDPLARMDLTPKELIQFQRFMNQNHEMARLITTRPVLVVQGCKDRLVRPEGTVELYNELGTTDRQLELIANGEHLIFEENQFTDEGITTLCKWLDSHTPSTKVAGQDVSLKATSDASTKVNLIEGAK
jgi:alpha-beta hydrolase superfamily lysophospholipase